MIKSIKLAEVDFDKTFEIDTDTALDVAVVAERLLSELTDSEHTSFLQSVAEINEEVAEINECCDPNRRWGSYTPADYMQFCINVSVV